MKQFKFIKWISVLFSNFEFALLWALYVSMKILFRRVFESSSENTFHILQTSNLNLESLNLSNLSRTYNSNYNWPIISTKTWLTCTHAFIYGEKYELKLRRNHPGTPRQAAKVQHSPTQIPSWFCSSNVVLKIRTKLDLWTTSVDIYSNIHINIDMFNSGMD